MDFTLVALLAAFAGGLFGAAMGGQPAFIITGFLAFVGIATSLAGSDFDFLGIVTFGPMWGPHVSFGGAVAAAAFAARRGTFGSGRDIATPIMGSRDPAALAVGGAFGMFGYLCNAFLAWLLTFTGSDGTASVAATDTIALTVGLSAILVRVLFGRTGVFGTMDDAHRERGRFNPGDGHVWVEHQQSVLETSLLGLGTGLASGWAISTFSQLNPDFTQAATFVLYAMSAVSLLLLQFGLPGPVTHHMSLPAAVAAVAAISLGVESGLALVLIGAVGGILGGLLGEFYSRLFQIHGDTHIDPPALAIAAMATLIVIVQVLGGAV